MRATKGKKDVCVCVGGGGGGGGGVERDIFHTGFGRAQTNLNVLPTIE